MHTEEDSELVQPAVVERVKSLGGVTASCRREGIGADIVKELVMVSCMFEGDSKTKLLEGV